MDECSGWQFLEEIEKKELSFPVVIVSSTIDIEDYEKSKTYPNEGVYMQTTFYRKNSRFAFCLDFCTVISFLVKRSLE